MQPIYCLLELEMCNPSNLADRRFGKRNSLELQHGRDWKAALDTVESSALF